MLDTEFFVNDDSMKEYTIKLWCQPACHLMVSVRNILVMILPVVLLLVGMTLQLEML